MKPTMQPVPVRLVLDGTQGRIIPAIVQVNSAERILPIINEAPDTQITVILPAGVSPRGSVFHLDSAHCRRIEIPIAPGVESRRQIPYWVHFHRVEDDRIVVHDWGTAASPPTMVLEP